MDHKSPGIGVGATDQGGVPMGPRIRQEYPVRRGLYRWPIWTARTERACLCGHSEGGEESFAAGLAVRRLWLPQELRVGAPDQGKGSLGRHYVERYLIGVGGIRRTSESDIEYCGGQCIGIAWMKSVRRVN